MNKKKILTIILSLAMFFNIGCFSAFAEEADVWDGVSATTEWYDKNTDATEFYISSASDLAGLAQIVNNNTRTDWHPFYKTTIYLTTDIDLNQEEWTPIGTALGDKTGFYGNFDGQNHTISNLWISEWDNERAGLFGYTHVDAEGPRQQFKNFTVENATVTSSKNYVGAVIASTHVANVENVHLKGEITIQGNGYVGGIVGHGYANMSNCTVEAEGIINSTFWCCGPLVGYMGEGSTGSNCKVMGTGEEGIKLWSAMAGIGGAFGMPQVNCTFKNISVSNVAMETDKNYASYGVGYIAGDYIIDPKTAITNSVVSNVTATVSGEIYTPADAEVVASSPEAEVTILEPLTLTAAEHNYMVWPSGDATVDRPLEIVMNFKAKDEDPGEWAKYLTDFYLTIDGLANDSIIADNCYLAGNYGTFGWIVIPTDGTTIENGVTYPVVSGYDATLNYNDICTSVKDFTAAIHIDKAILEANPNMTVKLELKMTNPDDTSDVLVIGEPAVYDVDDLMGEPERVGNSSYVRNLKINDEYVGVVLFGGIDGLDYSGVGFDVTIAGTTKPFDTTKVHSKVTVGSQDYTPDMYGKNMKYIFAYELRVPVALKSEALTFTPFAYDLDGNKIPGTTKTMDYIYNK